MGGTERLPLAEARQLAEEIQAILAPACARSIIAGSIRRQRPDCGDIELLAIPHYQEIETVTTDLFGDQTSTLSVSALDVLTAKLRDDGVLENRLDVNGRPAWGSSYKRASYKGFALDLFITTPAKWPCLLAIRTGPMPFTKRMVTMRSLPGGFCPKHLQFEDGLLVYRDTGLPVPGVVEEEDVFAALGVVTLPPELRTDNVMPPTRQVGSLA